MTVVMKEGYPLNFVRSSTSIFDDCDAENENYDAEYIGNYSSDLPFSEFAVITSPKMAQQPNSVEAGPGVHNGGVLEVVDQEMSDELEFVAPAPPNCSKSLVTGRKGFSAHFKNVAAGELVTQVKFPVLLTKAISLNESYEAACISRL